MDQEFKAEATVLVVFCANPSRAIQYRSKAKLFSIQDATIAAPYAQLTASVLGLSSEWMGGAINEQKVSVILGFSDDIIHITLLPIGYKNEEPQMKITRGSRIFHELK